MVTICSSDLCYITYHLTHIKTYKTIIYDYDYPLHFWDLPGLGSSCLESLIRLQCDSAEESFSHVWRLALAVACDPSQASAEPHTQSPHRA